MARGGRTGLPLGKALRADKAWQLERLFERERTRWQGALRIASQRWALALAAKERWTRGPGSTSCIFCGSRTGRARFFLFSWLPWVTLFLYPIAKFVFLRALVFLGKREPRAG